MGAMVYQGCNLDGRIGSGPVFVLYLRIDFGGFKAMESGSHYVPFWLSDDLFGRLMDDLAGSGRHKNRSSLLRQIVAEHYKVRPPVLPNDDSAEGAIEKTRRYDIHVRPSLRDDFLQYARRHGYRSWQSLLIDTAKERVYERPPLPPPSVDEIAQNNYQLAMIGKNLNQIARAINTSALKGLKQEDVDRLAEVEIIVEAIRTHLDDAAQLIRRARGA